MNSETLLQRHPVSPLTRGRVTAFTASSNTVAPPFFEMARGIGALVAHHGFELCYGGSTRGMMGALADGYLQAGGKSLVGVLPQRFAQVENPAGMVPVLCSTMGVRKELLMSQADVCLVLPGGLGTLDEWMEIVTHIQIGILPPRPVLVLDFEGFYTPFLNWLESLSVNGFAQPMSHLFSIVRTPSELSSFLEKGPL